MLHRRAISKPTCASLVTALQEARERAGDRDLEIGAYGPLGHRCTGLRINLFYFKGEEDEAYATITGEDQCPDQDWSEESE